MIAEPARRCRAGRAEPAHWKGGGFALWREPWPCCFRRWAGAVRRFTGAGAGSLWWRASAGTLWRTSSAGALRRRADSVPGCLAGRGRARPGIAERADLQPLPARPAGALTPWSSKATAMSEGDPGGRGERGEGEGWRQGEREMERERERTGDGGAEGRRKRGRGGAGRERGLEGARQVTSWRKRVGLTDGRSWKEAR